MQLGVDPDQSAMLKTLRQAYPAFEKDPFLRSVFWRISAIHYAAAGDFQEAVRDETLALQWGFPQAELFNERGCLRLKLGDLKSAANDFQLALKTAPNYTNALANLNSLPATGKTRPGE